MFFNDEYNKEQNDYNKSKKFINNFFTRIEINSMLLQQK